MTDEDKELLECKACTNLTPDMEQSAARTAAQAGGVMHCRECGRVYETCAVLIRTLTAEDERLREALTWALAEIEGRTCYEGSAQCTADEQRQNAFDMAWLALEKTK